jgi:uncharacterized protein (DUF1501 family)
MNRRTLLKLIALNSLSIPLLLEANSKDYLKRRNLIFIELKGGNDGLNTVVPYQNKNYYKYRPNIALKKSDLLLLNSELALHSSLKLLKDVFDKKELAIVQGLGYPNPNLSHFRSIEIWDTASSSQEYLDSGWIKSLIPNNDKLLNGIVLGGEYGPLFNIQNGIIKINNIQNFLQQSRQIKGRISIIEENSSLLHILQTELEIQNSANLLRKSLKKNKKIPFLFKKSNFGKQMSMATELINSNINIPFYKLSLKSFDTHTNQLNKHSRLLNELSEGISTMRKNLIESKKWKDTIIVTYSEFGRRVSENANRGTDHGTAAPHFIIGGKVNGGIYGKHPSLSLLDNSNNLIHTTDFRSLYATLAKECTGTIPTHLKLFKTIPIF